MQIAPAERQNRWITGFRVVLAVPAFFVASGYSGVISTCAFLGWFASLATGRMPRGLRNAAVVSLRYQAQTYGYIFLLTAKYPTLASGSFEFEPGTTPPSPS